MRLAVLGVAVIAIAAVAQAAERQVEATNGVVVSINGDEFDGKLEYTAPMVKFGNSMSFFLVAAVKKNGQKAGPIEIAGAVYYTGEWRHYSAANVRGGEAIQGSFNDRRVVTCSGSSSRGGCTLLEGFQFTLTDQQILKYATNGYLDIKLQAVSSNEEPVIQVPLTYIQAVREISQRPSD